MKLISYVLCFLCGVLSISVKAEGIGMMTGGAAGTYYKFGLDIKQIAKSSGVSILVKNSAGSIENMRALTSSDNAALAIVQSDALAYIKKSNDPAVKRKASRLVLMFPFYNEEVHVLSKGSIKSLDDLQGRVVAIGKRGSGTALTASTIFSRLGIKPIFRFIDSVPALTQLTTTGDVDAVVYVSGKPVPLFTNLAKLIKRSPSIAVHFLPIESPSLSQEGYVKSRLTSGDYSFVNAQVPTVAVKSSLVAYDFSVLPKNATPKQASYYRDRCESVGRIHQSIVKNLSNLQRPGFSPRDTSGKWLEVSLSQNVGTWRKNRCTSGHSTRVVKPSLNTKSVEACLLYGDC